MMSKQAILLPMIMAAMGGTLYNTESESFGKDFDLEKEYQLIQEKKSKYSSNDRKRILNMYNRVIVKHKELEM
jgi:hypothetical protein